MKRRVFLGLLMMVLWMNPVRAQTGASLSSFDARATVSSILVAGLVGGVLGLSTLSFYDRPQDNIRNITIGAGTGMIISALYLTFSMASGSRPVTQWDPQSLEHPKTMIYPVATLEQTGVGILRRF